MLLLATLLGAGKYDSPADDSISFCQTVADLRIAVLTSPESWYFRDLCRAGDGVHELTAVSFKDLNSGIGARGAQFRSGDVDLGAFDALIVRSMPAGSLEQIVFRMNALAQLDASGVAVVNPPRAMETAIDKYLSTARLQQAGLQVPETIACQTLDDGFAAFDELGGDVVVKPLFGSEGRGIFRLSDREAAHRVLRSLEQVQAVLYLQRYIEHEGCDYRVLVIGKQMLAMRRSNPRDWRTNVSRGASAEAIDLTPEWESLARRAAEAVGAPVAGVDLLPGRDGQLYVLEVNAVPGWRAIAGATGVDVAAAILGFTARLVNGSRLPSQ